MKNETQGTNLEFDQLLAKALGYEVDEQRLMRRVHSRLNNPAYKTRILQVLQAFPMRWPGAASAVCLLAAFLFGLFLPIDPATRDDAEVIIYAFGDSGALDIQARTQQPSFWR
jgi:hypothetical protein